MKIKDLAPNPKNPRLVTDEKLAMLKKALLEFGDLSGIVYNRKSKQLVGGHQRAKQIDADADVTITKKYAKPTATGTVAEGYVELHGERFSYREVMWDKHREMAANIAANKGAGTWDLPELGEWMKELASFDLDFDTDLTMFDSEEIKEFGVITVSEHTRVGPTGVDEDDVPEKAPPRTKPGDVYRLGDHRIMCGDARVDRDLNRLMRGKKANLVCIDPPYNVDYTGKTKDSLRIENDKMSGEKFYEFLRSAYAAALACTTPGGAIYVAHADSEGANFRRAMMDAGWLLKQCLVWVKSVLVMGRQDYHWRHEPILYGWAPGAAHTWHSDRKQTTVLEFDKPSRNGEHPTMKPVALIEYLVCNSSGSGELVLDTFLGSGTTLIACEKSGRVCYGLELDPRYCDVIIDRWEKYTGRQAKKVGSAQDPKPKLRKASVDQPENSYA